MLRILQHEKSGNVHTHSHDISPTFHFLLPDLESAKPNPPCAISRQKQMDNTCRIAGA